MTDFTKQYCDIILKKIVAKIAKDEQMKQRGQGLKTERDESKRSNEQLVNQIKDKDNLINAKTQENDALKKENDKLKESATNEANKLKQAEIDMKDVDSKSKDVLNSLN